MIKLIVAGGRDFEDKELLFEELDTLAFSLPPEEIITIVCGCAKGADRLGETWAILRGHKVKRFPADWKRLGKAAGPIRNKQMAEYATHLLAFWDGESKGTKSMIDLARANGLYCKVVRY